MNQRAKASGSAPLIHINNINQILKLVRRKHSQIIIVDKGAIRRMPGATMEIGNTIIVCMNIKMLVRKNILKSTVPYLPSLFFGDLVFKKQILIISAGF